MHFLTNKIIHQFSTVHSLTTLLSHAGKNVRILSHGADLPNHPVSILRKLIHPDEP